MKAPTAALLAGLLSLAWAGAAVAQHAGDLWVGRSAAGQLKLDVTCGPSCGFDPAVREVVLVPDELGGYSSDSPGFDRITAAQPAEEDTYPLGSGASVWLEIVAFVPEPQLEDLSISPWLLIYDPVAFTFYPYQDGATLYRSISLGGAQLHRHLVWFLDAGLPGFDPSACTWTMSLRLIDRGATQYAPSEPFELRFALHPLVIGDLDCDQDVDQDDLAAFVATALGPGIPLPAESRSADLDHDGDADTADFGVLQRCWTGPR